MACTGAYASPADFAQFWCLTIDLGEPEVVAEISRMLALSAADIHGPMAAAKACNCAVEAWALELLRKLNIIDMAVFYRCSCGPELSAEDRRMYLEWIDRQFELIRKGQIDLCNQGGADWPAVGVVELNHTAWSEAQIIANHIARTGI